MWCFVILVMVLPARECLHETFNLAMLWKLPVIFICENNNYAMGTSVERTSNVVDIYKLADAYEMPADVIDGMQPGSRT